MPVWGIALPFGGGLSSDVCWAAAERLGTAGTKWLSIVGVKIAIAFIKRVVSVKACYRQLGFASAIIQSTLW
jgi:hypothetical protein